ncbi:DUF938 domain-containing protein [soil metagenome]
MSKQFSAACERNQEPILQVLRGAFAECRSVLEIGSGTGQHAVFFGTQLPHLSWQTSDLPRNHPSILAWQQDARCPNVLPPISLDVCKGEWPRGPFDAVFSANTCHIMAWEEVMAMFSGVARMLDAGGVMCVYGPFNYHGRFSSSSNAQFDASLKVQAAHMGIRDFESVVKHAEDLGMRLEADHAMPANNRLLVFRKA